MIQAIVHTQGVVLGRTYVPLELAYCDHLGHWAHFLITSPISYSKMRRHYPHARPDVMVVTEGGTPYSQVLQYLKWRSESLGKDATFGYKGESYQPQVLEDAGIHNRINVEKWIEGALRVTDNACPWHKSAVSKCARAALEQIATKCASPDRLCAAAPSGT